MEFANTGTHCEVVKCNQQDFLPFRCNACNKSLCLLHRAYRSHGCDGDAQRDWTSVDCPICQKSVKFTRAQNADEVWEQHYLKECTKEASAPKQPLPVCGSTTCNVRMALSNRFDCGKCGLRVCLKCRTQDAHNCVALAREVRAQAAQGRGSGSSKSTATDKRKKGPGKISKIHDCPFCASVFETSDALVSHVSSKHGEGTVAPSAIDLTGAASAAAPLTAPASMVGASAQNSAECPLCGRRFPDENSLVRHASGCDGTGGPGPSDASTRNKNCRIS